MKKAPLFILLFLFCFAQIAMAGDANDYPTNSSPSTANDSLLGLDEYASEENWAIQQFTFSGIWSWIQGQATAWDQVETNDVTNDGTGELSSMTEETDPVSNPMWFFGELVTGGAKRKVTSANMPGSGGSGAMILDLGDDQNNESTQLGEIATTGDTNAICTEPSADKLLIDMTKNWPTADEADALAANGSNCSAGSFPLGVDAAGAVESCTDAWTEAENTAAAYISSTGVTFENLDTNGDVGTGAAQVAQGSHTHTFLDGTDTPASYTGSANKLVAVNTTPNGLEFIDEISNVKIPVPYDNILAGNATGTDVDNIPVGENEVVARASGGHVDGIKINETFVTPGADLIADALTFVFKDSSALSTSERIRISIPFNCTIKEWTMLADQSTTSTIDLWVVPYSSYPPTDSNSITASATPTITAGVKNSTSTLTGWTTGLSAGDTMIGAIEANNNALELTLTVRVEK